MTTEGLFSSSRWIESSLRWWGLTQSDYASFVCLFFGWDGGFRLFFFFLVSWFFPFLMTKLFFLLLVAEDDGLRFPICYYKPKPVRCFFFSGTPPPPFPLAVYYLFFLLSHWPEDVAAFAACAGGFFSLTVALFSLFPPFLSGDGPSGSFPLGGKLWGRYCLLGGRLFFFFSFATSACTSVSCDVLPPPLRDGWLAMRFCVSFIRRGFLADANFPFFFWRCLKCRSSLVFFAWTTIPLFFPVRSCFVPCGGPLPAFQFEIVIVGGRGSLSWHVSPLFF